jgi:hypothetical protein
MSGSLPLFLASPSEYYQEVCRRQRKTQYSALWMYNKLMHCHNPAKIEYTRTMFVKHMSAKDL